MSFVPAYILNSKERQELLKIVRERAVLRGDFVLSSGIKSNYYIDIKRVSLTGEGLWLVSKIFADIIEREFSTYAVAGVELGGVPLVCGVVLELSRRGKSSSAIVVRKKPKEHGRADFLEGELTSPVVLLEDVSTTGQTSLQAVEKLKETGVEVEGVICVVDRGGCEKIHKSGLKVFSIFHSSEIVK